MKIERKQLMPEVQIAKRDALPTVSAFDLVEHLCGLIEAEPADLVTHPENLKEFGE